MYNKLRNEKTVYRDKHKQQRSSLSAEEKKSRDDSIMRCVTNTMAYRESSQLLLYAAMPLEIETSEIFSRAIADGKSCFYPSCLDFGRMYFHRIRDLSELGSGRYGILEPGPELDLYTPRNFDICIVPALAYDVEGYRMGYGKGFYDRFLSSFHGTRIGVCYSDNVEARLPRGRYDIQVDILITEKGLFKLKKR